MPMSSIQLAALVEWARLKATPVVSAPLQPPGRKESRYLPKPPEPEPAEQPTQPTPPTPPPHQRPEAVTALTSDEFPIGWDLKRDSWHFHCRFYAIFHRPMRHGEYSHLVGQIRHRRAEHLWEDCWRVTLPGGGSTLPVRATKWRLITILPKHWQPPQLAAMPPADAAVESAPSDHPP
jgi:hypothetical protein